MDLTKDPADAIHIAGPSDPRQSQRQSDSHQLRRPGMPLLRAHARGAVSRHPGSLQGPGAVCLQGRSAHRNSSLGDACGRGRQLPGGAERRRLLDLRGLPAWARGGGHRPATAIWQRALPRWTASPGRRPRLANSTRTALDACIAKQDETQILASRKRPRALGIDGTPAVFVNGEQSTAPCPRISFGW